MNEKKYSLYAELMGHAIGLDNGKIFKRDGARIYIPYRNHFTVSEPDEEWEILVGAGYAEKDKGVTMITYRVTPDGIQWLVKYSRINICLTY